MRLVQVKERRLEKGWTQEVLAEVSGMDVKTVRQAEKGESVSPSTHLDLARALDVEPEDLLPERRRVAPDRLRTPPRDLPLAPRLLIGRKGDIATLRRRLVARPTAFDEAPHRVLVVRGWPGIGKTTLAAALAHDARLTHHFKDGVLWCALGQTPDVHAQLCMWGRALGIPEIQETTSAAEASLRLRHAVRSRQLLVIVDDVWDVSHLMTLQIAGAASAMLVTTRDTGVADAAALPGEPVRLEPLEPEAALRLLEVLAPEVVRRHRRDAEELASEFEYLPLALHVAGCLLRSEHRSELSVSDFLREIREGSRVLGAEPPADLVSQTTPTVAALLAKSTQLLDPDTRLRFAQLAPFAPEPDSISVQHMRVAWSVEDPLPILRELVARGLLEPTRSRRYQMHALLRLHALKLLRELHGD